MYPDDIAAALAHTPRMLVAAAALWVAGFDVVYSKGDVEFDRKFGLGSIAACFGVKAADAAAVVLLTLSAALYVANYLAYGLGPLGLLVTLIGAGVEVASAVLGALGRVGLGFNLNLAVGILIPTGIFIGVLGI